MSSHFEAVVIDCANPRVVGEFWSQLLGEKLDGPDDAGDVWIDERGGCPGILFQRVPEAKTVKNRLHIDLRPNDQDAEVVRAIGLGARHVDIGQKDVTWVVLADPEGNEFCILRTRPLGTPD